MQDRYAGDIGDYVKLALLRAVSPGRRLGVAWYLYPDEGHNSDGRHTAYLNDPAKWRDLDPELFEQLRTVVQTGRSVKALEHSGALGQCTFFNDPILTSALPAPARCGWRAEWFVHALDHLRDCDLVFADPDNGLIDDQADRRRQRAFGKQMPLREASALAQARTAIIYHHNTRYRGGHDLEVEHWQRQLGHETLAVRTNAFSCRTFFVVNPDAEIAARVGEFCRQWSQRGVRMH